MRYSIVIADKNSSALQTCLQAFEAQLPPNDAEIIVVSARAMHHTSTTTRVPIIMLEADTRALVPNLWANGLYQAQGDWVAFTHADCIPSPNWLNEIENAISDHVAVGGAIVPPPISASRLTWALYFLRYSNFMPTRASGIVDDIAGDNAIYDREQILDCPEALTRGFWETVMHDCLQSKQKTIYFHAPATMQFVDAPDARTIFHERFLHGQHYGSTRPDNTLIKRLLRIIAFPLIYYVLLYRTLRRIRNLHASNVLYALPAILFILLAWTLGEVSGYFLNE